MTIKKQVKENKLQGDNMGQYVTLTMRTSVYDKIIYAIMDYCANLNDYSEIEDMVHIIDLLEEEYNTDMAKQNKEFIQWQKREDLFRERFDGQDIIDEKGMFEYQNYGKINNIIEKYKEEEELDIFNEKQQFNFILDIIDAFRKDDDY